MKKPTKKLKTTGWAVVYKGTAISIWTNKQQADRDAEYQRNFGAKDLKVIKVRIIEV